LGLRQVSVLWTGSFKVLEFAVAQLTVEVLPKTLKFGEQAVERGIDGLAQPREAELLDHIARLIHRNQLVVKTAMLQTVVQVQFAGVEALPGLAIDPEFVAVPT
jgi:hypothetical protein